MKVVFMLVVLCAALAVSAAHRRSHGPTYDDHKDHEEYNYGRRGRYNRYHDDDDYHHDDHHGDDDDHHDDDHHERHERGRRGRYNRHDDHHNDDDHYDDDDDNVYRFHISEENYEAYQYRNEKGEAKGFNIDLMFAVCEHSHKECYFTMDKATNCWYSEHEHEYPGKGLLAGWFDGCIGLVPTVERKNSFDFTKSYSENEKVALYYRKESGLMDAKDDHELVNHKIGFVNGWSTSEACLDHMTGFHGNHFGEHTAVTFDDYEDMVDAVLHDKVDAILAPRSLELDQKGLAHTEPFIYCSTAGSSVMTQYGSDVLIWWDKAFSEMIKSGEFDKLCEKAAKTHGDHGDLDCVHH